MPRVPVRENHGSRNIKPEINRSATQLIFPSRNNLS